jgi:trk system potassium uptake protein TrkH
MIRLRPVIFVLGIVVSALAILMLLPALVDALADFRDDASIFIASAGFTFFIGVSSVLAANAGEPEIGVRESFVVIVLGWALAAGFGALPLAFSNLGLSPAAAYFEAMAGVTTTAASIITGLDSAPPGILLWRALLQWLGGFGTIAVAIAILPALQVGGMQIFRIETGRQRVLPRAAAILTSVGVIYVGLTAVCATLLWLAGMTGFEAVLHAMATLSAGGFSTSDQSIAHFHSTLIEAILILFMIVASLPFLLYLQALRGTTRRLFRDEQVSWLLSGLVIAVFAMTYWRWQHDGVMFAPALRESAFNVVSMFTGTGFTTADFDSWGGVAISGFLFMMVAGGCAGSAAGGIKMFRFLVIYEAADAQIKRLIQPSGLFVPVFNGRPIPDAAANAVMGFFFLFAASFAFLAMGLAAMGLDLLTSLSGAAAALANVGPGLGPTIGPEGGYELLPDGAKWLLSFGMLVGRLDIYAVLVLFMPAFWRG